jgi:peptide/nickel transport system permease protein
MRGVGLAIIAFWIVVAVAAPWLAPHDPGAAYRQHLAAPPMPLHLIDDDGRWHWPFVYPLRLANRLERSYQQDRSRRVPIVLFTGGKLAGAADERDGPWLPLGSDSYGRDVCSRLFYGARASLGVALLAVAGALGLGILVGGIAGYAGGLTDAVLMRGAELILVLPSVYVLLALRAALPLVIPPGEAFLLMGGLLALVGWPATARGVRAIVASEGQREYALAARSLGAGHLRLLGRHLLPAARGYLAMQAALLLPAFVLAEAVLSFVGFGFPDPVPSWGAMLQEAADVTVVTTFPWCLSSAVAITTVVLGLNLLVEQAEFRAMPRSGRQPGTADFDRRGAPAV